MKLYKLWIAGLCVAAGLAVTARSRATRDEKSGAAACFAQIKTLAGDWLGKEEGGDKEQLILRYRVTAGGTAVEETEFPGSEHEMITIYHLDGDNLLLTHYCHLGNQPRMKATTASMASKIVFECAGGTGMKSHNDTHMHAAKLSFPDKDHILSEWTLCEGGKPGFVAKFSATRKK